MVTNNNPTSAVRLTVNDEGDDIVQSSAKVEVYFR